MENKNILQAECMCAMCRVRRKSQHDQHDQNQKNLEPSLPLPPLPQNRLLNEDIHDFKKMLVKYTSDNKINLSNKQIDIFIKKMFEELHKKYIITYRSKL